ncbi:hypothetical protein [Oscillibacter sp. CU971]|uniref:hypothetical protein n=1 Tax=Oscillibacter sp. CU971 TaxID=2780102 RepID=UPI0013698F54|nr:hypothetical protein [Oscillibacter sp. CU971]
MEGNLTRAEHEEFARRMTAENKRLEDENTRQNRRLEQLENTVNQIVVQQLTTLTGTIQALKTSVDNTIKEQAAIGERVKKLEDKDGDMWRTAVKYVLSAVLGGVVVFIMSRIGIS